MKPKIDIIEIHLGIDIAAEIKKRTEEMTKIDIGIIKPKEQTPTDVWGNDVINIANMLLTGNTLSKEKICELLSIKETQISGLTGKLRVYLRTVKNIELSKKMVSGKPTYFIEADKLIKPLQEDNQIPQTQKDPETKV